MVIYFTCSDCVQQLLENNFQRKIAEINKKKTEKNNYWILFMFYVYLYFSLRWWRVETYESRIS